MKCQLTENENKKKTEILKNERKNEKKQHPKDIEKYFLEEYKASEENTDHKGGKKSEYDNDDDEEEPGMHRTVQCNGQ